MKKVALLLASFKIILIGCMSFMHVGYSASPQIPCHEIGITEKVCNVCQLAYEVWDLQAINQLEPLHLHKAPQAIKPAFFKVEIKSVPLPHKFTSRAPPPPEHLLTSLNFFQDTIRLRL